MAQARIVGLAALITPPTRTRGEELERVVDSWTDAFRTGGLDSWRLRFAPAGDAGRRLTTNYAANIGPLGEHFPAGRLPLFRWFLDHCAPLLRAKYADGMGSAWREAADVPEIRDWYRAQGYLD